MFQDLRKIIFTSIGIIIFIFIGIFSYYEYRSFRRGPEITNINIENYMVVKKPFMKIEANISNVKKVEVNSKEINIFDRKKIENIVVFSPGNNIINIVLEDIFGKKRNYSYNIYYLSNDKFNFRTLEEIKEEKENNNLAKEI